MWKKLSSRLLGYPLSCQNNTKLCSALLNKCDSKEIVAACHFHLHFVCVCVSLYIEKSNLSSEVLKALLASYARKT